MIMIFLLLLLFSKVNILYIFNNLEFILLKSILIQIFIFNDTKKLKLEIYFFILKFRIFKVQYCS